MRVSKDYRESAWDILRGRYWWAVLAGLIASLLGGAGTKGSFDFNFRYNLDDLSQRMQMWVSGQIDVEQIRLARSSAHDVVIPDLLAQSSSHGSMMTLLFK